MNWTKRPGGEWAAIVAMIAGVSILAAFQYRWTGEISRTEQNRLKVSLAASVRDFDQEFSYDFQQLCEDFELDPEREASGLESELAGRHLNWSKSSPHPELVSGIYLWKTDSPGGPRLEQFGDNGRQFQDADWPARLQSLRDIPGPAGAAASQP